MPLPKCLYFLRKGFKVTICDLKKLEVPGKTNLKSQIVTSSGSAVSVWDNLISYKVCI
jgi:hypothetical protein